MLASPATQSGRAAPPQLPVSRRSARISRCSSAACPRSRTQALASSAAANGGAAIRAPAAARTRSRQQQRSTVVVCSAPATTEGKRKLKVIVAGGGIAGLCAAIGCQKRGMDVEVYERVQKYKPFGGPIQMAGNATGALELIDDQLAKNIIERGVVTGDRLNGLLDGHTGKWYCRFDTRKPSFSRQLPLTVVMSRFELLDLLYDRLKDNTVTRGKEVMSYRNLPEGGIEAVLTDGSKIKGDVLIGADGIRSNVRKTMKGSEGDEPCYSGYTCYTGVAKYEPKDIDQVGYQVFLGYRQYFVTSDIGDGMCQWYAMKAQDSGMQDEDANLQAVCMDLYNGWNPEVVDRIKATPVEDIERRDIFDRRPSLIWCDGSAALIGDAAHAMQPNMGQGGCQAIEDALALAEELQKIDEPSNAAVQMALARYQFRRVVRASAVMGFARMAAVMTATYRDRLGEAPYEFYKAVPGAIEFWEKVEKLNIPHPGKVVGQIAMMFSIDLILQYITAGGDARGSELLQKQKAREIPEGVFKMRGIPGFAE